MRSASPDQFFIMTYVAQFYHKFSIPDSGYDSTSGLTTSFKYSSSEEDNTGSLGLRHKVKSSKAQGVRIQRIICRREWRTQAKGGVCRTVMIGRGRDPSV